MSDDETPAAKPPEFTDLFGPDDIEWRIQQTQKDNKERGLAVAYVRAEAAMERLDAVCRAKGWHWSDAHHEVISGAGNETHIECTITIADGDGKVLFSRSDVGEGHDTDKGHGADPVKTAYTDAFKRTCRKLGIARYLTALPKQWVDCDQYGNIKDFGPVLDSYEQFEVHGPRSRPRKHGAQQSRRQGDTPPAPPAPSQNGAAKRPPRAIEPVEIPPVEGDRPMQESEWAQFWTRVEELGYARTQIYTMTQTDEESFLTWGKKRVYSFYTHARGSGLRQPARA